MTPFSFYFEHSWFYLVNKEVANETFCTIIFCETDYETHFEFNAPPSRPLISTP